jgi:hypothetical protein
MVSISMLESFKSKVAPVVPKKEKVSLAKANQSKTIIDS